MERLSIVFQPSKNHRELFSNIQRSCRPLLCKGKLQYFLDFLWPFSALSKTFHLCFQKPLPFQSKAWSFHHFPLVPNIFQTSIQPDPIFFVEEELFQKKSFYSSYQVQAWLHLKTPWLLLEIFSGCGREQPFGSIYLRLFHLFCQPFNVFFQLCQEASTDKLNIIAQ